MPSHDGRTKAARHRRCREPFETRRTPSRGTDSMDDDLARLPRKLADRWADVTLPAVPASHASSNGAGNCPALKMMVGSSS